MKKLLFQKKEKIKKEDSLSMVPCPPQGVGMKGSLKSLPTQRNLGFWDRPLQSTGNQIYAPEKKKEAAKICLLESCCKAATGVVFNGG